MIEIRKAASIFAVNGGWFSAKWHFSFSEYYDPAHMSFGTLRVFNDDTLIPDAVWPMHPHREMEVITYCVEGEFEHADDIGNGGVLMPGDVQHTTIGRGMMHSEINHRKDVPMRFLQLWIMPAVPGLKPSVEQRKVSPEERKNRLLVLVSGMKEHAKEGKVLPLQQDAAFYSCALDAESAVGHEFERKEGTGGYGGYLYVLKGKILVKGSDGQKLMNAGDAAKIRNEKNMEIEGKEAAEFVLVEVRV